MNFQELVERAFLLTDALRNASDPHREGCATASSLVDAPDCNCGVAGLFQGESIASRRAPTEDELRVAELRKMADDIVSGRDWNWPTNMELRRERFSRLGRIVPCS